jgi:hypothetical protein
MGETWYFSQLYEQAYVLFPSQENNTYPPKRVHITIRLRDGQLKDWGSIPSRGKVFVFSTAYRTAMGLPQHPVQWVPGSESDHLHQVLSLIMQEPIPPLPPPDFFIA